MRYAIVTETWPPEINGVALTVQSMTQGLRARGHEVSVIRPRQSVEQEDEPDTLLVRGAALPRYPGLKFGLPATGKLTRRWHDAPPDAIYVATEGPLGWSALRAAKRLGIPTATGFHTRFDSYMRDYGAAFLAGFALCWMRWFHNHADTTLVPTLELAEFLRQQGFANVTLLRRAVDSTMFHPSKRDRLIRKAWGIGKDTLAVIHVGRIACEKNLDLAVRAFRELEAHHVDARFIWVGDGPERERIARDNPDFIFCGVQRGTQLARYLASADLFLFPSRSETFGNVTLEALASGVPTIAFDYGAAREHLKDGAHGAAITDGDDQAFIDACLRIGSNPRLRSMMRLATREAVATLQPETVAEDFDVILQTLRRPWKPNASMVPT